MDDEQRRRLHPLVMPYEHEMAPAERSARNFMIGAALMLRSDRRPSDNDNNHTSVVSYNTNFAAHLRRWFLGCLLWDYGLDPLVITQFPSRAEDPDFWADFIALNLQIQRQVKHAFDNAVGYRETIDPIVSQWWESLGDVMIISNGGFYCSWDNLYLEFAHPARWPVANIEMQMIGAIVRTTIIQHFMDSLPRNADSIDYNHLNSAMKEAIVNYVNGGYSERLLEALGTISNVGRGRTGSNTPF